MVNETSSFEGAILSLISKIKLLIGRNSVLRDENEALKYQIERLLNERAECRHEIEVLKTRLESSYMADSFVSAAGGKKQARKAIEKILREIDDCVAMINK
ncbi:MAG: hypothetical protein RR277_05240 [Rikenellaceae bacterium]